MEYFKLNNNVIIPSIGLGTYLLKPNDAYNSTKEALTIGYRLIDTANFYENERSIGKAIKESNLKREEIFISTKLWPTEYENEKAIDETLERLNLEYIDLLFLHQPTGNYIDGYKMLEKAYKEGKIKSIGLSNFEGDTLQEILNNCEIKPQVIQVECHPYYNQETLRKEIEKENIKIMSWYPLGHGDIELINENIFTKLANKYNKTNTQIILKWHIKTGFIVIPGSKNKEHIKDNFNLFDFDLTEDEMQEISNLNKNIKFHQTTKERLIEYTKIYPNYESKD